MGKAKKKLDAKIEEWANSLADRALDADGQMDSDEIAAFKAVAGYYASSRKITPAKEDEGTGGFDGARKRIIEASESAERGSLDPADDLDGEPPPVFLNGTKLTAAN